MQTSHIDQVRSAAIPFFIDQIYVSPGHNFKDHFGRDPDNFEAVPVDMVECIAGSGLIGDRFFDHKPDFKGQITFFDMAVYKKVCEHFFEGKESVAPSVFRRNIITRGLNLNSLIGKRFSIGDVEFSGSEECSPCFWMNQACAEGAHEFLMGQGGLRARIHTDGVLRIGEAALTIHH